MAVKVSIVYSWTGTGDRRYSDGEAHWLPALNALDGSQDTAIVRMVNARMAIMGGNVQLVYVRQSLFSLAANGRPVASRQRNRIYNPGQVPTNPGGTPPGILSANGGYPNNASDQPKSAILAFLDGQTGGGQRSYANKYLSGIPDDIVGSNMANGTLNLAAIASWAGLFAAWLSALQTGGFAFLGTAPVVAPQPYQIIRWANETGGAARLMFTIMGNPANWVQGNVVHVRAVRMAIPRSPTPRGLWRIDAISPADSSGNQTYTLQNTSGFQAANIISPGTVESVGQAFYTYLGTGTPQRATARKRGASAGASRGKSRPGRVCWYD